MELTGGHDSRLLLALVLRAGLQHQFTYRTWGTDSIADVTVAAQLAEQYDLDHNSPGHDHGHRRPSPTGGPVRPDGSKVGFDPGTRAPLGVLDSFRHHCWATSAGLSLWDRVVPHGRASPNVSVSGLFGELLRARNPAAAGFADLDQARAAMRSGWLRFDPGSLLRPEVREHYADRTIDLVAGCIGPAGTVQDGFDGLYLRQRLQPWRGVISENSDASRVFPYLSPGIIRTAFALGPEARRDELLAFTLVHRIDPWLAKLAFAGRGWPERVVRGRPDAAEFPTSIVGARWKPSPDRSVKSRRRRRRPAAVAPATHAQEVRSAAHDRHVEVLTRLLDLPPSHRLHDLVDRRAVQRTIVDRDASQGPERAIYDAATAAIWLDRLDTSMA